MEIDRESLAQELTQEIHVRLMERGVMNWVRDNTLVTSPSPQMDRFEKNYSIGVVQICIRDCNLIISMTKSEVREGSHRGCSTSKDFDLAAPWDIDYICDYIITGRKTGFW